MEFHRLPPFHVRFSETDAAGVAHFSQILRWAENAESDFFRAHGIAFAEKNAGTLAGWPRVKVTAEFFSPARYDDEIFVEIRPTSVPAEKSVAVEWEFTVSAGTLDGGKKKIAKGAWTTVYALADIATGTFSAASALPDKFTKLLKENSQIRA